MDTCQMKKSYILLFTIILISIFSYLSLFIYETKSLSAKVVREQYLYLQAKNHLDFFKEYIKETDLTNINKLELQNKNFEIYANIKINKLSYLINIYVKSKDNNISLHESFTK